MLSSIDRTREIIRGIRVPTDDRRRLGSRCEVRSGQPAMPPVVDGILRGLAGSRWSRITPASGQRSRCEGQVGVVGGDSARTVGGVQPLSLRPLRPRKRRRSLPSDPSSLHSVGMTGWVSAGEDGVPMRRLRESRAEWRPLAWGGVGEVPVAQLAELGLVGLEARFAGGEPGLKLVGVAEAAQRGERIVA